MTRVRVREVVDAVSPSRNRQRHGGRAYAVASPRVGWPPGPLIRAGASGAAVVEVVVVVVVVVGTRTCSPSRSLAARFRRSRSAAASAPPAASTASMTREPAGR